MTTLERYLRAFVGALRMTLRGERPLALRVDERFPNLSQWWRATVALTDAAIAAAEGNGLDRAKRQALIVRVDRRDVSMETILAAVRFHAAQEFPHLMRADGQFNYLAIQATILNDRYLVHQLGESTGLPAPVKLALDALGAHLASLPSPDAL
jgi:hypothetical protein